MANIFSVLSPPVKRSEVGDRAPWPEIEQQLGTRLPSDYKNFIDRFGSGTIGRFVWIFSPYTNNEHVNLERQLVSQRDVLANLAEGGEDIPFDYFPGEGGLFPFGATDNGDVLYWRTKGAPDDWTVIVNEARGPKWESFELPMTEFLTQILTRQISCSIFPDDFPPEVPTFVAEHEA